MLKEEDVLDSAVQAALLEPNDKFRIAFGAHSNEMMAVRHVSDADVWQLTESPKTKTGDSLFRNEDLVLIDLLCNERSKAGILGPQHEVFTWEDVRDPVQLFSEALDLGPMDTYFVLGYSAIDAIRGCLVEGKKCQEVSP